MVVNSPDGRICGDGGRMVLWDDSGYSAERDWTGALIKCSFEVRYGVCSTLGNDQTVSPEVGTFQEF